MSSDHQLIHFNFLHRTYLTPKKQHAMDSSNSPFCSLCSQNLTGSFYHMYWLCDPVSLFWNRVSGYISKILGKIIPCSPRVLLLNDVSAFQLSIREKCVFLSGITAAKKLLALRGSHHMIYQKNTGLICGWRSSRWNCRRQGCMVRVPRCWTAGLRL